MDIKFDIGKSELASLIKKVERLGVGVASGTEQIMEQATDKLLDESVKRAPIEEGFLEESHDKEVEKKMGEIAGHVFIPENSPASDYAVPMHEGEYNLGEYSTAKQAGQSEIVGRKYLERALNENKEKFITFFKVKLMELIRHAK